LKYITGINYLHIFLIFLADLSHFFINLMELALFS